MSEIIAIPSEEKIVNAHFGRSKGFDVYEISDGQARELHPISMRGFEHQHAGIAGLLKSNGIAKVICGGIGGGMVSGLQSVGIEVISGAAGLTAEVAKMYANGTLQTSGGSCENDHGGHDHHHHH